MNRTSDKTNRYRDGDEIQWPFDMDRIGSAVFYDTDADPVAHARTIVRLKSYLNDSPDHLRIVSEEVEANLYTIAEMHRYLRMVVSDSDVESIWVITPDGGATYVSVKDILSITLQVYPLTESRMDTIKS